VAVASERRRRLLLTRRWGQHEKEKEQQQEEKEGLPRLAWSRWGARLGSASETFSGSELSTRHSSRLAGSAWRGSVTCMAWFGDAKPPLASPLSRGAQGAGKQAAQPTQASPSSTAEALSEPAEPSAEANTADLTAPASDIKAWLETMFSVVSAFQKALEENVAGAERLARLERGRQATAMKQAARMKKAKEASEKGLGDAAGAALKNSQRRTSGGGGAVGPGPRGTRNSLLPQQLWQPTSGSARGKHQSTLLQQQQQQQQQPLNTARGKRQSILQQQGQVAGGQRPQQLRRAASMGSLVPRRASLAAAAPAKASKREVNSGNMLSALKSIRTSVAGEDSDESDGDWDSD